MKPVLEAIARGQERFARLPFFERLERAADMDDVLVFGPGLTFFAMVFQDILRLCEAKMVDPSLRKIVSQHRAEDRGHDIWFLDDMERLGTDHDVRWLFGPTHRATRDSAYALVSEVFRASDDHVRLTLLWVLEASGEVFFSRVPDYIRRSGQAEELEYFSAKHHDVERGHMLLESNQHREFASVELTPSVRAEALGVVERAFDAFVAMFTNLEAQMEAPKKAAVSMSRLRVAARSNGG